MTPSAPVSPVEKIKADFIRRLDAFMENRKEDIGDPSGWQLLNGPYDRTQVIFQREGGAKIRFNCAPISVRLSEKEKKKLEDFMKESCAKKGFGFPERQRLASSLIEEVREGNPKAWDTFVGKHRSRFVHRAEAYLGRIGNRTMLDPEDFVQDALMGVFRFASESTLHSSQNPSGLANLNITREIGKKSVGKALLKQSDGRDFNELPQPEYDDSVDQLAAELPKVIELAQNYMSDPQKKVFNIILTSKTGITMAEIAKMRKCTVENVRHLMEKITQCVYAAAMELECEKTAFFIRRLMKANSEVHTHRTP